MLSLRSPHRCHEPGDGQQQHYLYNLILLSNLFTLTGYKGTLAVQPDSAISMLQTMYLWLPVVITLVITFIMSRMKVEKANEELRAVKRA